MRSCRDIDYQTGNNNAGVENPRRHDRSQYLVKAPPIPFRDQDDNHLTSTSDILQTKNILDAMPAGVVGVDSFGCVNYFNNKAAQYLGPLNLGEQWRSIIERCFKDAYSSNGVMTTQGYMVNLETGPMPDKKGQIIIIHDISKTAELKKTRERFARLAELGELSARMAHQIRTPLAASMLFLSGIKDSLDSTSRQYKNLMKGIQGLQDIESMIADMLLFTSDKSRNGKLFDITDLIYALENDTEVLRQQYQCVITFHYGDSNFVTKGNLYAIKSAISNIIENSAQACMARRMRNKKIENEYIGKINVYINPCDEEKYSISIKIADNGPGIPNENLENILKPFYTTKQNGTGLGLAVVKSVIDSHNGELKINSSPGSGTETIVSLP